MERGTGFVAGRGVSRPPPDLPGLNQTAGRLDGIPSIVARLARDLLDRCSRLDDEIKQLDAEISALVEPLAPSLLPL